SVVFFSSRRRHTRFKCDWSSDVCSSDLSSGSRKLPFGSSTSTAVPTGSSSSERLKALLRRRVQSPSTPRSFGEVTTEMCRRGPRSEEHTSELQSHLNLVCRLLLEKKNNI